MIRYISMNDEADNQTLYLQNLMREAKHGNSHAFEAIYEEYYTPLFRYIRSRVRNTADADDITQTVFMRIWSGLPKWNESHTSPTAFFFHIARNIIIDTFRKKSYSEVVSNEIVSVKIETESVHPNLDTSQDVEAEKILSYVKELSDEQQEILSLLYTNDLSYREIAEILGKNEDAIRQTHSRAIKKLRTRYEQTT